MSLSDGRREHGLCPQRTVEFHSGAHVVFNNVEKEANLNDGQKERHSCCSLELMQF